MRARARWNASLHTFAHTSTHAYAQARSHYPRSSSPWRSLRLTDDARGTVYGRPCSKHNLEQVRYSSESFRTDHSEAGLLNHTSSHSET
eukprot:6180275-Pleurochrysis_carterae.AAC.1